jgi:pimeloyl-ACP methyl ester carboxylesterase
VTEILALLAAWCFQAPPAQSASPFRAYSYDSQTLGKPQTYRVLFPPSYSKSITRRYGVVYWLHGVDAEPAAREARLAAYVATHELILVDPGPGNPASQFALYFPEIVEQVDGTLRTVKERGHRAVAGVAGGGFLALLLAGKYPDMVGSVSSFEGTPEGYVGPDQFPVEYNHDNLFANYDGVSVRVTRSSADSLAFYHRRMDSIWSYTHSAYQSATFLAGEDLAEIDRMLDFHMASFALPLAKPAVFSHADTWPNFMVWGWEVVSNRRQPAYTVLENVSNGGFRSSVREYLPGGATVPEVKLSIGSPAIYPPGVALTVTYIHLIDGKVRRAEQRVDAHGRLSFDISGDAWEVAVSNGPLLEVSGYTIEGANWATAGQPVSLMVRFWNKGSVRTPTSMVRWESPNPGVTFATPESRLYFLNPGDSANLPVKFTVNDPQRAIVKIVAVSGTTRLSFDVPLFPPAEPAKEFQIADGRSLTVFQHATQKAEKRFGEGNGDGHAAPGENFAVLIPDSGALRAAELFTNDSCVDNVMRGSDSWDEYDHSGASAEYSLPSIHVDCEPGHPVHMIGRILIPNGPETQAKYFTIEFPVWYRRESK